MKRVSNNGQIMRPVLGDAARGRETKIKFGVALPFCHFCKKGLFLPFSAHFLNMKNWPKKVNLYFFAHFSIMKKELK
jgi:hypothetical protein